MKTNTNKKQYAYICAVFLLALSFITIFSKCSPLYAFNNSPDASVIFEVGHRMFSGDLLYKDVIDQKGPFLFTIHGLASLISYDTYLGLYAFEIIFAFISLLFVFKTVALKYNSGRALFAVLLTASLLYTYPLNTYGGDTAELMMMPFLMYLYYLGYRYVNNEIDIKPVDYLLVGITSGCVLWTKYTMLGIYVAWFIIPALDLIKAKNIKKLILNMVLIVLGVGIATIPWIVYFGANNYFVDFIKFYFLEQASYYKKTSILSVDALTNVLYYNIVLIVPALFGLYGVKMNKNKKSRRTLAYNLLIYAILFIFIYIIGNGVRVSYYSLELYILIVPCAIGIFEFYDLAKGSIKIPTKVLKVAFIGVCLVFSVYNSSTIRYINEPIEDTPYYKFAEYIEESGIENPVIYGNAIDSTPLNRYMGNYVDFKYVSPLNSAFPEMVDYIKENLKNGDFDFFITVFDYNVLSDKFPYEPVMEVEYFYQGSNVKFILYQSQKTLQ